MTFNNKELLALMELQQSGFLHKIPFSLFKLRSDARQLEKFYKSQGFVSPEIIAKENIDTVSRRVDLNITIQEGPRIIVRAVNVTSNPAAGGWILRYLKTHPATPLIYTNIDDDIRKITDTLQEAGYLRAHVEPVITIDSSLYAASVLYFVKSGPRIIAGEYKIEGGDFVRPFNITRELTFRKSKVLRFSDIRDSERNLYRTRLFNFVKINPAISDSADTLAAQDTTVPVIITVEKAQYFTFETGGGYSSYERIIFSLTASYTNLFARGHTITLNGGLSSIDQRAELIYSTPWVYLFPFQFLVSAFYERHDNLFFTVPLGYKGEFAGLTASIGNQNDSILLYQLSFILEDVIRISAPTQDSIPSGVPDKSTESIVSFVAYDKRDNIFNPKKGYYSRLSLELAGLGGAKSNQFVKSELDLSKYESIRRLVFSSGIQFGWSVPYGASKSLPLQDQFFGGGPRSVRGFNYEELVTFPNGTPKGGEVLLVLHLIDFQFPVFWWFDGAVFSDAGYVWQNFRSVDLRDLKFTAGPGLRVETPVGLVRFDLGFQLARLGMPDSWVLNFDIGRPF